MPMEMDELMRDMMAWTPKELSEASEVTNEAVALYITTTSPWLQTGCSLPRRNISPSSVQTIG